MYSIYSSNIKQIELINKISNFISGKSLHKPTHIFEKISFSDFLASRLINPILILEEISGEFKRRTTVVQAAMIGTEAELTRTHLSNCQREGLPFTLAGVFSFNLHPRGGDQGRGGSGLLPGWTRLEFENRQKRSPNSNGMHVLSQKFEGKIKNPLKNGQAFWAFLTLVPPLSTPFNSIV